MASQEGNEELDQGVTRDSIAIPDPSGGHDTARAHGRESSDHSLSSDSKGSEECSKPVATHELSRRQKQAFERLPEEIIQQILYASDPNAFASLVLLNREWRRVSRNHKLYAFQLARCPSYAIRGLSVDELLTNNDLLKLQRLFYLEVKRNLFDTFLRPAQTLVKLVSTSVSSSSAFPGGEAFHFAFSSNGHFVLALSSSRIYLLSTTSSDVKVTREFKVLRRPVAAAILDDASILAVLSTDHQVNIYNLGGTRAKHVRSVPLDNPPRTIALSPGGSVLAAAYDGGIEVYSLAPNALSTDRRAVKCDAVDSLSFSEDGTLLLGTTVHSPNPNTVILSAPYYHEGGEDIQASELLSQMWTTSILFPNNSRDCSHATLLPRSSDGETSWAFTHDRVFETFRAVRVDDLRNGTTYFTGPLSTQFMDGVAIPTTLPSSNDKSEIVASGFAGREIFLYGVPENLDLTPESGQGSGSQGDGNVATSSFSNFGANSSSASTGTPSSPTRGDLGVIRLPQWQVLCDKFRNVFTKGRLMSTIDGLTAVHWVSRHESKHEFNASERLVAVAPGLIHNSDSPCDDEEVVPLDGGRIIVYDFDVGIRNGNKREIVIELGEVAPELLEEETRDLETEVALVRRRTVAQKRGGLGGPGHSGMARASTVRPGDSPARNYLTAPGVPPMPGQNVLVPPTSTRQRVPAPLAADNDPSYEEIREALDGPYTHNNPRSGTSLQRAATTAAANRRNMPPLPPSGRVEYRRGRRDPPHESDADNWVPPPPPYTESADQPLPDHLIMSLLPRRTEPLQRTGREPLSTPVRAQTSLEGMTYSALQRTRTTIERAGNSFRERRLSLRRALSDESQSSQGNEDAPPPVPRLPVPQSLPRSVDHPVLPSFQVSAEDLGDIQDDLYRITPPQTPRAASSTNMRQETEIQQTSMLMGSAVSSTLTVNSQDIRSSNEVDRQENPDITETIDATPLNTTDTADTAGRSERDDGSDLTRARGLEREVSISPSSPSASLVEVSNLESTASREMDNESTAASSSQPDLQPSSAENHPSYVSEYRIPRRPVNSSLLSRGPQALSLQTSQLPQEARVSPTSSTLRSGVNRAISPSPPSSSGSQNLPSPQFLDHERSSSSSDLQTGIGNESMTPVPPSPEQISALQRRYSGSNDLNRPRPATARPSSGYGVYNPEGGYTRSAALGLAQGVYARTSPTGSPNSPPVGNPQTNQGIQSMRHSGYGFAEQISQRGGPPNDSSRNALYPRNRSPAIRSPGSRSSGNRSPGTRSPSARSPAASTPSLTLRPDLPRLDTIHSVASQHSHLIDRGRGSIYLPGAASKSAEDLKANKRRGWSKLKRGKDEERKGASKEESWEDVKRAWIKAEKEKKSSKCFLM